MKEDLAAFLVENGIAESEYLAGTLAEKATLVTAFEKSKEGN